MFLQVSPAQPPQSCGRKECMSIDNIREKKTNSEQADLEQLLAGCRDQVLSLSGRQPVPVGDLTEKESLVGLQPELMAAGELLSGLGPKLYESPYCTVHGCLGENRGSTVHSLCNLAPWLAQEVRLDDQCQVRKQHYPRGNVILTGEFFPKVGESGIARFFPLQLERGDVDRMLLSFYQEKARAGELCRIMMDFTNWLAEEYLTGEQAAAAFGRELADRFTCIRDRFTALGTSAHGRTIEAVAHQLLGFDMVLRYLEARQQLDADQHQQLIQAYEEILQRVTRRLAALVQDSDPCRLFLRMLAVLMETGQVTVLPVGDPREPENLPISMWPISEQDKGGMLPEGCNPEKTPPGNAVRGSEMVC